MPLVASTDCPPGAARVSSHHSDAHQPSNDVYLGGDRSPHRRILVEVPRHHRRRRKRDGSGPRAAHIPGRVSLADRPAIVHRRGRLGDGEGDLVVGRGQRGFVAMHGDRRRRVLLAAKVARRTAEEVTAATRNILQALPPQLRRTRTVDNGSEWAMFSCLQTNAGTPGLLCRSLCRVGARDE